MKKISALLVIALLVSLLAGCAGTPVVYYTDCTCPPAAHQETPADPAPEAAAPVEGALKTGLAVVTNIGDSVSAADAEGEAAYDVTLVAVLVDDDGVIRDCKIDGIKASVKFDTTGAITSDLTAAPQTKNELGENYGMVAWGGAIADWDAQAAAFAEYITGMTLAEVQGIAITETTKPAEGTDLAASCTIAIGGFVGAVEKAVANADHRGAQGGDTLKLVCTTDLSSSAAATAEAAGNAQLDVTAAAVTVKDGIITTCAIDSVQAKVAFDAAGTITSDVTAPVQTKNELGENYGMVAWGGAIAEWDAQADAFATYIAGKTLEEVQGIAVTETTKPAEGTDLAAACTIAIGGFQALIAKAFQ